MTISSRLACLLLGTAAAVGVAAGPAAAAVDLLSHRAVYRLSLLEGRQAVGVTDVKGGLVMEWRESCEGSISNQRLGFVASMGDGPGFVYDVRFSSWESVDNTRLRFNVRSFDDGQVFEEYRGEAALEAAGGSGQAAFSTPAAQVLDLPRGTLFPTEHMRQLVDSAARGEVVISHAVFDGSGVEGLSRITAVIGRARVADRPSIDGAERSWPVSLAYHGIDGADDLPNFEITFDLSERGVLYDLVLDYGDLALRAELEQLDAFPAPRCP